MLSTVGTKIKELEPKDLETHCHDAKSTTDQCKLLKETLDAFR